MAKLLLLSLTALYSISAFGEFPKTFIFRGPWVATNTHIDGDMTAVVTRLSETKWKAKFFGVWQGSNYTYSVEFSGPPQDLRGTAEVDFIDYTWSGSMDMAKFTAKYTGRRHRGYFELARDPKELAADLKALEARKKAAAEKAATAKPATQKAIAPKTETKNSAATKTTTSTPTPKPNLQAPTHVEEATVQNPKLVEHENFWWYQYPNGTWVWWDNNTQKWRVFKN